MFNNFANYFMATHKSIISDLFCGINCYIYKCGGCNIQTFNYQTYFFLGFPLEEVIKFKNNNQINNNNNEVSIEDCFNYDKKINIISGENSIYCNYCKSTCNSSMSTILTTVPQILIILLNRKKENEYTIKINYPEFMDLNNYIQLIIQEPLMN